MDRYGITVFFSDRMKKKNQTDENKEKLFRKKIQFAFSKFLLLLIITSFAVSLSFVARGAKTYDRVVQLTAGRADTVELNGPVADVLVANPSIADVGTLRSNRLYIVGRAVGDTNVLAYDDAGNQLGNITVHVRVDDKNLQDSLKEFFPTEKISARTVKDNIVLSGTVSSPSVANQVRDLASRFAAASTTGAGINGGQTIVDLMTVRGEQQVMLKVKVIEANRSVLKELGVETDYRATANKGLMFNGNDVGRASTTPFGTGILSTLAGSRFGPLTVTLRAMESNGLVNTLAEPNLTAISGETAGFLAGGEYPVPTGRDAQGNVTIEFKQFGVSLNFTPTVLNKERIALHLSTEVSEKDKTNGVVLQNVQIDGLSVRRAETTVELGSGSTIMIAGLIKSDTLHSLDGLPGVQDLPVLGQLFKSKSFARDESELVIMVTPFLVNSYAQPDAIVEAEQPSALEKALTKVPEKSPETPPAMPEKVNTMQPAPAPPPAPAAKPKATPLHAVNAAAVPSPLYPSFIEKLKKTYGKHLPEKIGAGAGFGYIVD
jgi:pilus assembly protein CpaC